jgi:sphinganine-1-phosphate aldolase
VHTLEDVRVLGEPDMCMFSLASDTLNVFELDDEMARRGWALQPQFSAGGGPANLHLTVNRSNVPHVDELLADLGASIATVKANSRVGDVAALQAQVEQLMQNPSPAAFAQIAALAGLTPGSLPTGYAQINTVLDALPDVLVDALLIEYLNGLYG